ncbi:MAG: hypothetical protein COV76_02585 [Candidatus Omnitrophica bacterium CG11_big_fil_rev_8_21_14_0_20_64_10]|nr:MAG: hypothetical protein COV76_02585 [Candidatus Omnitrophica bacterium CG11_big_fil_rev_8_21_14_0_20_64_10]
MILPVAPRLLIVRTDRIGDLILSTPVFRTLRAQFPGAYLAAMIRPEHRELVDGNPDLNAVIPYDKSGSEKSWIGTVRFAQRLKRDRFDAAVILHSTNRTVLATWLAGIPRRIGYARRLGRLLTDPIPYVKRFGLRHELEYNLDLLARLGVTRRERILTVPVPPAREAEAGRWLKERGIAPGERFVVLHPGASCPSKRWPAERFAETADRLARDFKVRVLLLTGPDGLADGRAVAARVSAPLIEALGGFSLGQTAAVLKRAACLVSNDSGPVHLASAVGTPVVSIFGRWGGGLSPARWGPTGPESRVLHRDVGCRPCLAHRCPIGFVCLSAISVEEVLTAAGQVGKLHPSGTP